jgi:adenine-specific DNA-methyltransferase
VQQAHKQDRISFASLTGWPGEYICAEGRYLEGDKERRAGIFIGPEFGTVARPNLVAAAREAADAGFDVLIACAFNFDAHSAEFEKLGRIPVLKARMNPDLHMADALKNTGAGNLFVVFGEPDIEIIPAADGQIQVKGVDVFRPQEGRVDSDSTDTIALWTIDTDYNEESFRPPRVLPGRQRPLQGAEDHTARRDRCRSLVHPAQRHLAPLPQAEVRADRSEGNQSPGRRGDEGLRRLTAT